MSKTIKSVLVALIAVVATMSAAPVAQATGEGFEGCTPGYWKNHTDNWEEASPGEIFGDRFDDARANVAGLTFLQTLQGGGGKGLDGAAKILARAATAAWLNAAHDGAAAERRVADDGRLVEQAAERAEHALHLAPRGEGRVVGVLGGEAARAPARDRHRVDPVGAARALRREERPVGERDGHEDAGGQGLVRLRVRHAAREADAGGDGERDGAVLRHLEAPREQVALSAGQPAMARANGGLPMQRRAKSRRIQSTRRSPSSAWSSR